MSRPAERARNPYYEILDRSWRLARPTNVFYEMTHRCNHRCLFCSNPPVGKRRELTLEEIDDFIDQCREMNILFFTLTGGEPLVHPHFFEIGRRIKEAGFALRVFSNGSLIDGRTADDLKELGPFEIELSLHGARAETHDEMTGVPGSFMKFSDAARFLKERGMKVNLKCVVTRLNQGELREVKRFADDIGFPVLFDPQVTPRVDGTRGPLDYAPDPEFLAEFWSASFDDVRGGAVLLKRGEPRLPGICGSGRSQFMVDPYGDLYPCSIWARRLGNVREQTIKEIWETSEALREVRDITERIQKRLMEKGEWGRFCFFCPGMAEACSGNPEEIYPQAEASTEGKYKRYLAEKAVSPDGEDKSKNRTN